MGVEVIMSIKCLRSKVSVNSTHGRQSDALNHELRSCRAVRIDSYRTIHISFIYFSTPLQLALFWNRPQGPSYLQARWQEESDRCSLECWVRSCPLRSKAPEKAVLLENLRRGLTYVWEFLYHRHQLLQTFQETTDKSLQAQQIKETLSGSRESRYE
jgi:hypothetical protein